MCFFPGKSVKSAYAIDVSRGSAVYATDKDWVTQDAFYHWIETVFILNLPPKSERGYVMFLLDGHSSHKNYRTSKMCRRENDELFCLPSHISHVLQPLDKAYFSQFKTQ